MSLYTINNTEITEKIPHYLLSTIEKDNNLENQVEPIRKILTIVQKLLNDTNKDYIMYMDTKNNESPINWENPPIDVWLSIIQNLPIINYAYQQTLQEYGLTEDNYMTNNINTIQQAGTPLNTAYHIIHWKLTGMKIRKVRM